VNGLVATVDFKPRPPRGLRYSLAVAALRLNTTSAELVMNENVAKFDLIFEGSNNRR
jgi:hypothetical protein